MLIAICLLAVVMILGFVAIFLLLQKKTSSEFSQQQMENVVNQVFGLTSQKISEQSRQILQSEKEVIRVDLENKHRSIEKLVQTLHEEITARQTELRTSEFDRNKKFGELSAALEQQRKLSDDLRISTQQLANVLSNNQLRGGWGERIIEDLLRSNGLIEGVHYNKQTHLENTKLRPDITLLLPNQRNVPVDVKFPYSEIQKMALADAKEAKEEHLKQFAVDLKTKVTKVAEYINPEFKTLDFAILFVPNEMIFSFINQRFPDIVDDAMSKRVMIVSPFTFLIVARMIIESYRNFMMEDKLRDIIQYVNEFTGEWDVFKEEFAKFGRSLETLQTGYQKLSTTRTNQMEKKIRKIENYHEGNLLPKTDFTSNNT